MQERATIRPPLTDAVPIGFCGKLPSHGDFVSWGLPTEIERLVMDWLQGGLKVAREHFGDLWEGRLRAMPPWRFVIEGGLWGNIALAGAVLASIDRVGRRFPLIVVAQIPNLTQHPRDICRDDTWFTAIEAMVESCIRRDMSLEQLTGRLQKLRHPRLLESAEPDQKSAASHTREAWWWTVQPGTRDTQAFRSAGAPSADDFLTLLAPGDDPALRLQEAMVDAAETAARTPSLPMVTPSSSPRQLGWSHALATHPGTRGRLNSDALLASKAAGLFAVADGQGDTAAAGDAAKLAVHLLGQAVMNGPIEARLHEVKGKLGRANSLLQARARNQEDNAADVASMAALILDEHDYLVAWAGNARCYLLRDGMLRCLTRDHLRVGLKPILSRAVGLSTAFTPECTSDHLKAGDHFLLCTAPIVYALSERVIAEIMLAEDADTLPTVLIENGLIADCRDNMTVLSVRIESAP